jgi:hypothetical protein
LHPTPKKSGTAAADPTSDDSVDLEALNLIHSDVFEGLDDGGCDPLILQTPVSQSSRGHPKRNKPKIKKKSKSR